MTFAEQHLPAYAHPRPHLMADSRHYQHNPDFPVKSESPTPSELSGHPPYSISAHHHHHHPLPPSSAPSLFRFGSGHQSQQPAHLPSFNFMAHPSWNGASSSHQYSSSPHMHLNLPQSMNEHTVLSMNDDYDDGDELSELPGSAMDVAPSGSGKSFEKIVRRRSSKGPYLIPLWNSHFCVSFLCC